MDALLIATGNPGKAREFREMLGESRFAWRSLDDVPPGPDVEETGHTFRANACLKAAAYATRHKSGPSTTAPARATPTTTPRCCASSKTSPTSAALPGSSACSPCQTRKDKSF